MARMVDTYVKCPFYVWEEGNRLCCEGVTEKSSVQILFADKSVRREYERRLCKKDWKNCPLAQALTLKWEKDTGGEYATR